MGGRIQVKHLQTGLRGQGDGDDRCGRMSYADACRAAPGRPVSCDAYGEDGVETIDKGTEKVRFLVKRIGLFSVFYKQND